MLYGRIVRTQPRARRGLKLRDTNFGDIVPRSIMPKVKHPMAGLL